MERRVPCSGVKILMVCVFLGAANHAAGYGVRAAQTRIATAANFAGLAAVIGARFTRVTGHRAVFSFGSTGQLYAQISRAAPFSVYLAADTKRPQLAVREGLAMKGTMFTYALGRIALYSVDATLVRGPETLKRGAFQRLAIANPATAPYGSAAIDVLANLGLATTLAAKIVRGNNIAQVYQFVSTGNAEAGFVALGQIAGHARGSRWIVPAHLHKPIAQAAVLLNSGKDDPAARAFLAFLRGPEARKIITRFGYAVAGDREAGQ